MTNSIRLRSLTKEFDGAVRAVDTLDVDVHGGEFFALLGPSGCGKTTLLRTIAGLEDATAGTIHIGDTDVTGLPPGKRDVAMVFQDYALFPHMTVAENVGYPAKIAGKSRQQRTDIATEVAAQLGLSQLLERRPGQLSGGQQQRAALARAVACHPKAFLFDEPLSNLDARLRLEARTFLKRLQRELNVTTVFVTHDQAEALALADRIAVMEAGRIRQLGTARDVFNRPANTFVANFIGSTPMNLLPARVNAAALELPGGSWPIPEAVTLPDGDITVGVRPEYVELGTRVPDGPHVTGSVSILENLGTTTLITVDCADTAIAATVPADTEPEPGTQVWLRPEPGRLLVYDDDGELINGLCR